MGTHPIIRILMKSQWQTPPPKKKKKTKKKTQQKNKVISRSVSLARELVLKNDKLDVMAVG